MTQRFLTEQLWYARHFCRVLLSDFGHIKLNASDRTYWNGQQKRTFLNLQTFDIWISFAATYTHSKKADERMFSWISGHSSVAWRQWSKLLNLTAGHCARGNTFWSKSCFFSVLHSLSLSHTHTQDCKRAETAQKLLFHRTLIKREQAFTFLAQTQNTQWQPLMQTETHTHI